jgi:BCCT family betaine/carnitine transporter
MSQLTKDTTHELGDNNIQVFGMDIHNPVFAISAILIILFVIATLLMPAEAKVALESAKSLSINYFDWLFMAASNVFILFCLALLILPVGRIRIGGDAKPEFSTCSWFSMLFAAGMGIA